ncbi:MAG TPA: vWA domain-containing protein [Gaiellaceae bacterium]|nr:vWA domain-containing protein [Gaiellaceae bacterium]
MRPRLRWASAGRVSGVDTHDVSAFPTATWRARILRAAFAVAAIMLVAGAAWSTRGLETQERGLLPSGTTGVVVVDLSLSITDKDYDTLRGAFRRLIDEDASIGLVVFSDVAYELLPPGTPASQLRPVLRLLVPPRLGQPVNPWTQTFRSGTQISAALQLAKSMLERDGVRHGSVLLVSDLETAPDDVPALTRVINSLKSSDVTLRVVGLGPSSDARRIFAGTFVNGVFDAPAAPASGETATESHARAALPIALLILGALSFVALAAHERFAGRLALSARPGGPA